MVLQVESDDNTARADKPALCGRLRKERRPSRKGPQEELMQRIITIIGLLAIAAVGTAQVEEVWARRYCPDEDFWHHPSGLAVDDHGNVYVTGRSRVESDNYDYATIKYSPDGTE